MSKFHVAVVGSRPHKNGNRNVPFPHENTAFVNNVLARVPSEEYASISHGASDYGVDAIAEYFAMNEIIKQKQYRPYWFIPNSDPAKRIDKAALIKAREAMVRDLTDSVHNKTDEFAVLLVFHTQDDPRQDEGLKSLLEFVTKYHPKIQVRTFQLPVTHPKEPETTESDVIDLSPTSGIPDPFAVPQ